MSSKFGRSPDPAIQSITSTIPSLSTYKLTQTHVLSSLWSNYGSIARLVFSPSLSLILKRVSPPPAKGKKADESHLRKLLSYEVESWFYAHLAPALSLHAQAGDCKIAKCYSSTRSKEGNIELLMEDLSVSFPESLYEFDLEQTLVALRWLACFHATFWGKPAKEAAKIRPPLEYTDGGEKTGGVWTQGGYWYFDTRKSELKGVRNKLLLNWVEPLDKIIKEESKNYGTLVHGDPKGENILFSPSSDPSPTCAMYDFQYVGLSLPTRDLVYFLCTTASLSVLSSVDNLLDYYLSILLEKNPNIEYRQERLKFHWELMVVDWYRFMEGWGRWGSFRWVEERAEEILKRWEKDGEIAISA
ncbi:hypothetical protein BT69DRAFT_1232242 [Atractiella rhizophila]|nr:hypothetical protein BT69DRAFT_1232242 [Atractiella rhizophila]